MNILILKRVCQDSALRFGQGHDKIIQAVGQGEAWRRPCQAEPGDWL